MSFSLIVNGTAYTVDVEPDTPLLWVLRDSLKLTGTKYGCGIAQCGACTVHMDGRAVKCCNMLVAHAGGRELDDGDDGRGIAAADGTLHPMQEAFREHHGLQCGFCTPGMIMTAVDLVQRKGHDLADHTIREELEGNLCRCTGYHNIVKSIAAGAKAMASGDATRQAAE